MRESTLSPRLFSIAQWVHPGAHVADIGADHGQLSVWLLKSERAQFVIATDLRDGPLSAARSLVAKNKLEDRCRFIRCDGLSGLAPGDADTLILAGMGGETIAGILRAAPWTRKGAHRLLLQPMSKAELLREFLAEHGFEIEQERLVQERHILYPLLNVRGGSAAHKLTAIERYGSVGLFRQEKDVVLLYLDRLIERLTDAAAGLKRSIRPENAAHLRRIVVELDALQEKRRYIANGDHSANL